MLLENCLLQCNYYDVFHRTRFESAGALLKQIICILSISIPLELHLRICEQHFASFAYGVSDRADCLTLPYGATNLQILITRQTWIESLHFGNYRSKQGIAGNLPHDSIFRQLSTSRYYSSREFDAIPVKYASRRKLIVLECATAARQSRNFQRCRRKSTRLIATLAITRDANRGVSKLSMIRDADEGGKQRVDRAVRGARRVAAAECGRTKLYREGGRRTV